MGWENCFVGNATSFVCPNTGDCGNSEEIEASMKTPVLTLPELCQKRGLWKALDQKREMKGGSCVASWNPLF